MAITSQNGSAKPVGAFPLTKTSRAKNGWTIAQIMRLDGLSGILNISHSDQMALGSMVEFPGYQSLTPKGALKAIAVQAQI